MIKITGRRGRLKFFIIGIFLAVLYLIPVGLDKSMGGWLPFDILSILFYIVLIIFGTINNVKRLHDMNRSGYLVLICFIPYIGVGMGLYMLFKKGTIGPNDYGEDPRMEKDVINQYSGENMKLIDIDDI